MPCFSIRLLFVAMLSGHILGVIAWQHNVLQQRGFAILHGLVIFLGFTGVLFGKAIENGELLSPQNALTLLAWLVTNISFAVLTFYAIRTSKDMQRWYQPKRPRIQFSLATLIVLLTAVAIVAAAFQFVWLR